MSMPDDALPHCVAPGCGAVVPAGREWCPRHWGLIPKRLQTLLYHYPKDSRERGWALKDAQDAVHKAEAIPDLFAGIQGAAR